MRASAPASSGNLGPGYDVLGLALDLRCTVEATAADRMTVDDGDGPSPLEPGDMLYDVVDAAVGLPMALRVRSDVPRARGLGSSSAVTTAAAAAAARAVGREPDRREVYEIVATVEGHGDNAAPAVWGGLQAVGVDGPRRLEISDRLIPVVGIPDARLSTKQARRVVPTEVTLAAAVRNVARAVLLVEGLRTADPDALGAAAGDEFHESARGPLSPITGELMSAARSAGALHVSWSGAGPTAIALATAETRDDVVAALDRVLRGQGFARALRVDLEGLR